MTDFDAIVIGSGSGGLTAALALARAGKRVVVYEQHDHPGGYTQSFTLDGFVFSPGVHYVGGLGPGGTLRRIYEGLGLASYDAFAAWRDSTPGHRPNEYRRLKQELTERMLDTLAEIVPGIRNHVVVHALGTPLTNERCLGTTRGAIYGTEKTIGNLGPFAFPIRTHVHGLFECGASTLAPGLLGVSTSGVLAAAAALGGDPDDVLSARGQTVRISPAEDPAAWPPELGSAA